MDEDGLPKSMRTTRLPEQSSAILSVRPEIRESIFITMNWYAARGVKSVLLYQVIIIIQLTWEVSLTFTPCPRILILVPVLSLLINKRHNKIYHYWCVDIIFPFLAVSDDFEKPLSSPVIVSKEFPKRGGGGGQRMWSFYVSQKQNSPWVT